jgi:hypothetical protein
MFSTVSVPHNDDINNMSVTEINRILKSKVYLPTDYKKKLMDKLSKLGTSETENNFFEQSFIKNNSPVMTNLNSSQKINKNDFPEIGQLSKELSHVLNYKPEQFHNSDKEKLHPTKNTLYSDVTNNDESSLSKFYLQGNQLVINFNDILDIYENCNIYLTKLHHMELNNKIHVLNSLRIAKNDRWKIIHNYFGYDFLLEKEEQVKKYLDFCASLVILFEYFTKITNNNINEENYKNFVNLMDMYNDIINKFGNDDMLWNNKFSHFKNIFNSIHMNFWNDKNSHNTVTRELETLVKQFCNSTTYIGVQYFNTNNNVYNVAMTVIDGNIVLVPYGVSNSLSFISFDDVFDISVSNLCINDFDLQTINEYEIESIFRSVGNDPMNFIHVTVNDYQNKSIDVKLEYDIDIELVKDDKNNPIDIEFINVPKTSHILISMIKDDIKIDDNLKIPKINHPKCLPTWLKSRCDNYRYPLSNETYNKLDKKMMNTYSRQTTDTNLFFIDYLFNELTINDPACSVIDKSMQNSFRILAAETSIN